MVMVVKTARQATRPPRNGPSGAAAARGPGPARLSIGARGRASGIPVETLRTWESRYGYPIPERKPSGHRVYPLSSVARLRRIAEALSRGHRAGEVVPASETELTELLAATGAASAPPVAAGADPMDLLPAIREFDAGRLHRALLVDWARLGPVEWLRARVAPLVRQVGEAWQTRRLDVRHEHFFSERLTDVLRTLRLPLEEHARGPLVVLATLPGELHGLGLQMVALVLTSGGCRVLNLGVETPETELVRVAGDLGARAVGVSVSAARRGRGITARLARIRRLLPRRVTFVIGGEGAPRRLRGVEVIHDLAALHAWARRLAGAG
jgi:DNA-binding transcriptional MerR regulator